VIVEVVQNMCCANNQLYSSKKIRRRKYIVVF